MLWLATVLRTGFKQVFFIIKKDSCNSKQHDGIYVNGLTCYMVFVLTMLYMLSGTTLYCGTGFAQVFFVCVTTFWGWMQAGVYINALSIARHLNHCKLIIIFGSCCLILLLLSY